MYSFADWHCDTASKIFEIGEHLLDSNSHINIKKLQTFDTPVQMFAVWLKKEYYSCAYDKTVEIIKNLKSEIDLNNDKIVFSSSYNDILKNNGKINAMLSIEGAEALEGSIDKLHNLYKMGVRLVTLTWNYKNCVATGVRESSLGGGLTKFGETAVKEMENMGIIIDVSHLSDEGFYDVARKTEKPFVASHSNCRALCSFPRNLTDDQLKIIGDRGGVVGLNMCTAFLNDNDEASTDDVIRHIDHMLNTCGENSISFGCDYDGIPKTPVGMDDVTCIVNLIDIIKKNYGLEIAEKIAYKNYFRVLKALM